MSETEQTPAATETDAAREPVAKGRKNKAARATKPTTAEVQQAAKRLAASPSGEAVVATYLGGEDERSQQQLEDGVERTVDEHEGRPIMGVTFPEGEEVPVTGDVLIKKLRSLAAVGIFTIRPWEEGDGEPQVQKLFVEPKRDMAALRKKALAAEAKRRGSVV